MKSLRTFMRASSLYRRDPEPYASCYSEYSEGYQRPFTSFRVTKEDCHSEGAKRPKNLAQGKLREGTKNESDGD